MTSTRVERGKVAVSLQPLLLLAFYGLEHVKGGINGLPVVGLNRLIQRLFGDPAEKETSRAESKGAQHGEKAIDCMLDCGPARQQVSAA
jgi:hypothetical protein